jgi:signal peptidase I
MKRIGGSLKAFMKFGFYLIFALGFALFYFFNFHTVVVHGESMLPTFQNGQHVMISKAYWLIGPIQDNDIVVLHDQNPDGYIIKRVYRLAGQTVDWVNAPDSVSVTGGEYKVPLDCVYVLGDNRLKSEDSRKFGPVQMDQIIGKVVVRR